VIDKHRRVVVGATFTGSEGQDMLQAATFAVVGELTLEQLWHGIAPFPTRSEIWLNLLEATGLQRERGRPRTRDAERDQALSRRELVDRTELPDVVEARTLAAAI
jgi:hypothetical protein